MFGQPEREVINTAPATQFGHVLKDSAQSKLYSMQYASQAPVKSKQKLAS
jgi:hypothetical protein